MQKCRIILCSLIQIQRKPISTPRLLISVCRPIRASPIAVYQLENGFRSKGKWKMRKLKTVNDAIELSSLSILSTSFSTISIDDDQDVLYNYIQNKIIYENCQLKNIPSQFLNIGYLVQNGIQFHSENTCLSSVKEPHIVLIPIQCMHTEVSLLSVLNLIWFGFQ